METRSIRWEIRPMKRLLLGVATTLGASSSWADPLDTGEAYVDRAAPPAWMDKIDFGLLLVDYGIFALTIVAMGWLLIKRSDLLSRLESRIFAPFSAIFAAAKRVGGVGELLLQMVGGMALFLALAAWVFFCQWLKHVGLGALSMAGLALVALLLVRMIKGKEREIPVP